jgi:PKD repeat protein
MVTDPGFGLTVSGWHGGGGTPPPPTCADGCDAGDTCQQGSCQDGACQFTSEPDGTSCDTSDGCTVNGTCQGGTCSGDPVTIDGTASADGKAERFQVVQKAISFAFTFTNNNCDSVSYSWDFGDGTTSTDAAPTHSYATPGDYTVSVDVSCDTCDSDAAKANDTVRVVAFKATIAQPTGDPATAPSPSNQFTYTGISGKVTIPVQATIDPASVTAEMNDRIQWILSRMPNGSALTWDTPSPVDATTGANTTNNAQLAGYPTTNDQFGNDTIVMKVLDDDDSVLDTQTAPIQLFFARDDTAVPLVAPNWFRYFNQTGAGNPNAVFNTTHGVYGTSPAMLLWRTYAGSRDAITIDDAAITSAPRRDGSHQITTGIDLFADVVAHETRHVRQVHDSNTAPFFTGVTGVLRDAPAAGWSFNVNGHPPHPDPLWNHFIRVILPPFGISFDFSLDTDFDDLPDTLEPSAADFAACATPVPIECQAQRAETIAEDTFKSVDWGDPGKQHP